MPSGAPAQVGVNPLPGGCIKAKVGYGGHLMDQRLTPLGALQLTSVFLVLSVPSFHVLLVSALRSCPEGMLSHLSVCFARRFCGASILEPVFGGGDCLRETCFKLPAVIIDLGEPVSKAVLLQPFQVSLPIVSISINIAVPGDVKFATLLSSQCN